MQRLASLCYSGLLLLGLTACDKSKDTKADDAKQADKQADKPAAKPDDAKQPDPKPVDEPKPADATADEFVDDTKGLGMVARELAGDDKPPAPGGDEHYDTSKDEGGLIGHVATALAHDDELAAAATTAELLKLAGEEPGKGPSDGELCKQVWTAVVSKAYPDLGDAESKFAAACKAEVEKQRVKLGVEIFTQHAECVMAAGDLAALDVCDAAEQEAEDTLHKNPHGDQPESTLCVSAVEHMFILINRDIGTDADMLEALEEDIYTIKDDAKLVCHDEATKAELECVMKAAKLADLESC